MSLVATIAFTPLALLRLSWRARLILTASLMFLTLSILWIIFPVPPLDVLMLFPLTLASWLFSWLGGLLCLSIMIFVVMVHYELAFGTPFWPTTWGTFTLTRILGGCFIYMVVAGLRQMTDALLEAQRASQQAHRLNEMKDQILYSLSHELRNPLTQVLGYLDLLEDYREQLDNATQNQYFASVRGGCEEVLDLISTVLETARMPKQSRAFHPQTISLYQEIQTVLTHTSPSLLQEYPIHCEIPPELQVHADPRFIRQIVRNLLLNAFKYTPPHTSILVKAGPLENPEPGLTGPVTPICVQIIDAGPGIHPEQQTLLFQPFVRLPNASTSKTPGTGLGLAICKQLVEAMGGQIWLESSGRAGEGCCFSFTLASANPLEN